MNGLSKHLQDLIGRDTVQLDELSWSQVEALQKSGLSTVVLSVGSTEQHGPHMPLMTDALAGDVLAEAVARELGDALAAPTLRFGVADHHLPFPGTVSLRKETFKAVVHDYLSSLASHGFEKLLVISSHGGNFAPLQELLDESGTVFGQAEVIAYTDLRGFMKVFHDVSCGHGISAGASGTHAGEWETSLVLAARPDLVRMEEALEGFTEEFTPEIETKLFTEGMPGISANGIIGDARPATGDHGRAYLQAMTDHLVGFFSARL